MEEKDTILLCKNVLWIGLILFIGSLDITEKQRNFINIIAVLDIVLLIWYAVHMIKSKRKS